jgi:hypothetical protein
MSKICKAFAIFFLLLAALVPARMSEAGFVIDFEGLADEEAVTNQFSGLGVTFSGQVAALQAGASLNEQEFPPHSGVNVIGSDLGQIDVAFTTPQASVGAFVTYSGPVTFTAFNAQNAVVATAGSALTSNTVSSGNTPNESITLAFSGITHVTIAGPPGDFTVDDLTGTPVTVTPAPEPGVVALAVLALATTAIWPLRAARQRR